MDKLIEEYSDLIYSLTHYFENYKDKQDLYQVGFIGLINAYKKFDPTYNVKFSTYAYPYILGEMKKLVREDKGVKISREITKLNLKIEKARLLLSQQLFREPTIKELEQYLSISSYYIEEALRSVNKIGSIDEKVGFDNTLSLHEVISDKEMDLDTLIALKDEIKNLKPEEKMLIKQRYLDDMTQSEVANNLNMSQVQVSRFEQKIKQKIKSNIVA